MAVKDYYSILQIPASANVQEIKQAFRHLALQYHPDKTAGDADAQLHFEEIKEAYDTLTDPGRKERYLQDRWVYQVNNQALQKATHPENSILALVKLKQYSSRIDDFRGGQQELLVAWQAILHEPAFEQIGRLKDPAITAQIVELSLGILAPVRYSLKKESLERLSTLPDLPPALLWQLQRAKFTARQEERLAKWRIPFLLVLVLIICLGIYFLNQ